jgi:hypothetical protein
MGSVVARIATQNVDRNLIINWYDLAGPEEPLIPLLHSVPDFTIDAYRFYGGPRDYLVPTPNRRGPTTFVTTEIAGVWQSMDHNMLLYNELFINKLALVIRETMIMRL